MPWALALLLACPASECALEGSLDGFVPDCAGSELLLFDGESRLRVPGLEGGAVVAFLPPPEELSAGVYGGTSGRYLFVLLRAADGSEEAASDTRNTTLTIGRLSADEAEVRVDFRFGSGSLSGPLEVPVVDRR